MQPFRIEPVLPPQAFKTHLIKQPLRTHWRRATCAEVDCPRYLNGWKSVLDVSAEDGAYCALWIRAMSGLRFTEEITGPGEVTFRFPPGQMCARADSHRLPLGRPPIMLMRGGDHRTDSDARSVVFQRAEDWRDDLGETLENWRDRKQRG